MGYSGGGQSSILAGQPPVYYRTYQRRPDGLLSPEERKNITVAIVALTAALTMVLLNGARGVLVWYEEDPFYVAYIALVAFVSTATAFFLHEMAHKFVAQHYGCWAEFRYSQQGLLIAVALAAFAAFLFAAPGAVYIAGRIDQRQNGIISIAGPLTNVVVVVAALPIIFVFPDSLVASGFYTVIFFNAFLAIFNMIPVMPLDGAKVLRWNVGIYAVTIALMGGLLLYVMLFLPSAAGLS